ncbi:MAG: transglycosylase SLT domain-containing protein [Zymomonas mobilis subsp. pomaceae]|uniref:Lytic transglycosylase catalytic n=1 Tax=Zymomonas mobilis subsp. pomaceae (strain ATCC 29192 / DSM 22645 / JCM 10191 / CCUG 17912 / NBRC 13757 / NCIMB 11200 / NRRL B-4491 / Barker I) TaxID=579138 RepID=F8ETK9_ZYMMT|nr:lytic transglycosylase domain-containing protein [Zymomonas mobilis]AEI37019.1 Lytic transglycosylase catalytic [Zymomonas mobilis subsp. pomaceae ATCC 29192]MDX5948391.1 transglycosylase SLT domain-containing protein [Zymomonas mobilis subsp. pomaceae]GEB89619.1 lytic transglycosylase [Zymomonas mobilis subsp. pomaceae]
MKQAGSKKRSANNSCAYGLKRSFKLVKLTVLSLVTLSSQTFPTASTFANTLSTIDPGFMSDSDISLVTPQQVAPPIQPVLSSFNIQPTDKKQTLSPAEMQGYRACFKAIRRGQWQEAQQWLEANPDGLLTNFATAELYLTKGSPKVPTEQLISLIKKEPDLPQNEALERLAFNHGARNLPSLPSANMLTFLSGAPQRPINHHNTSNRSAAIFETEALPLLKADNASEAEVLFQNFQQKLPSDLQTEWAQRIAWSYYLNGNDDAARRLAVQAENGQGSWTTEASWVEALADWQKEDFPSAMQAFSRVAAYSDNREMKAAGLFWQARAAMACGHPEYIQNLLRAASQLPETFYGILAEKALGKTIPALANPVALSSDELGHLTTQPNIRTAIALNEIGEHQLATETLKYQARLSNASDHNSLIHLAAYLHLPEAQLWLAHHGPAGFKPDIETRYPAPNWTPASGWHVDPYLIYAHALQESQFRTRALSAKGARGVMQITPSTARLVARQHATNVEIEDLDKPTVSFEYGQAYIEWLRDTNYTGGLLPKVIAAYNAGPAALPRWNNRDHGDPLLFIESIPYAETRAYVATVLRNYWIYQQKNATPSQSLKAMAQGMWPRFPGMAGESAIRLGKEKNQLRNVAANNTDKQNM